MSNPYGLTTNLVQAAAEPRYPVAENQVITMPDANLTLPVQPTGGTVIVRVGALGAARTLTLPSLVNSSGVIVHVIIDAAVGNNLTVAAPAGTLCGVAYAKSNSAANSYARTLVSAGSTSLRGAGTRLSAGDSIRLTCDGVKWNVNAACRDDSDNDVWTFI